MALILALAEISAVRGIWKVAARELVNFESVIDLFNGLGELKLFSSSIVSSGLMCVLVGFKICNKKL